MGESAARRFMRLRASSVTARAALGLGAVAGALLTGQSSWASPASAPAAPRPSAVGRPLTSADILTRAGSWVAQRVPYSQSANAPDPTGRRYRTDCSGFISMAWGLTDSLTTRSLPSVARTLGSVGDYHLLQPGDMIDSIAARHVVLFLRWADPAQRVAVVAEEAHTGTTAHVDSSYYTTDLLAEQQFVAYRYVGMKTRATPRDWDGDGIADVISRRTRDGALLFVAGAGAGPSLGIPVAPRVLASHWPTGSMMVAINAFDHAGTPSLLVRRADGSLWDYPGDGTGGLAAPHRFGPGWNQFTQLLAPGDVDGDGQDDLTARTATGAVWLFRADGAGGLGDARLIAAPLPSPPAAPAAVRGRTHHS